MTGSPVVPHNYDLQEGLNKVLVDLRESAPADSRDKAAVRSKVTLCIEVFME